MKPVKMFSSVFPAVLTAVGILSVGVNSAAAVPGLSILGPVPLSIDDHRINEVGEVTGISLADGTTGIFSQGRFRTLPYGGIRPTDINDDGSVFGTITVLQGPGSQRVPSISGVRVTSATEYSTIAQPLASSRDFLATEMLSYGMNSVEARDPQDPLCLAGGVLSFFCSRIAVPTTIVDGVPTSTRERFPAQTYDGFAHGINNDTTLAGELISSPGGAAAESRAFIKYLNQPFEVIPLLGGLTTGQGSALAINDHGVAVGSASATENYKHAFRYVAGQGVAEDLTPELAGNSTANAISEEGMVVGQTGTGSDARAIFVRNGVVTDLNSLLPASFPARALTATDLNESRQIVGEAQIGDSTEKYVYLFSFVETKFKPTGSCVAPIRSGQPVRRGRSCSFQGDLTDYRGRRLAARLVEIQYAANQAGPWVRAGLAMTDSHGRFRKTIAINHTGLYRARGPLHDAQLPAVPSFFQAIRVR